MDIGGTDGGPAAMVERLRVATNAHDLEALVGCFAADYRNETPAHPERGFTGRDQVRRNWAQIFAAVPDVTAEVAAHAPLTETRPGLSGSTAVRGPTGPRHLMRGVVIFGVRGGVAEWARFYLEPVQADGDNADAAVRRQLTAGGAR